MVVKSKDEQFPMILDVPAQGVRETFRSYQDIEKFFKDESALWATLLSAAPNLSMAGASMASVAGRQAAKEAAEWASEANRRVEREGSLLAALRRYEGEKSVLLRGTIGKLILDREGETEQQTAGVIWAAAAMLGTTRLRQATNQNVHSHDLAALTYGQLKLTNAVNKVRAERANIQRIVGELNDHLADAQANNESTASLLKDAGIEVSAAVSEHKAAIADLAQENAGAIKALLENSTKQVTGSVYETKQTLEETLRTSAKELDEFKRKVRIDVGLEEPTNFWTDKANGHRLVAGGFGVVFLLAVVGMVYWIDGYAVDLVADAVDRIVGDRQAAALSLVPIAFITVPALAFAWILRHLSRIIIQNLSLEADARLRGTITRTFKALAADRAMNDAELAIALQALFRPIDGKDHSEIAPPTLADILKLGGDAKP